MIPGARLDYTLHWGEKGPKHADAWAMFEDMDGATRVTLGMVMATAREYHDARGFGAETLGWQTLRKLAKIIGADQFVGAPPSALRRATKSSSAARMPGSRGGSSYPASRSFQIRLARCGASSDPRASQVG